MNGIELMERYESETGGCAFDEVLGVIEIDYVNWLESKVIQLQQQLTWRDVSENPEGNDLYLCKYHDDGESDIFRDSFEWLNGKWLTGYNEVIIAWLPIPKE